MAGEGGVELSLPTFLCIVLGGWLLIVIRDYSSVIVGKNDGLLTEVFDHTLCTLILAARTRLIQSRLKYLS